MGNNFSSKYELFRNVKADDKKGLNKNYGIFLVLRRKTGLPTPAFLHPLPLLPLSDRHPHFIPRLLADLKTDILAQADYITDAAVLISDSHIDHAAVIRLAVKCGMYLHSSSAEFLPDIIRKTHVSAALPVRFTDQGFIFIHFSVHLPYLLLAVHIRRTIYAV